ncbi:hypothetical protein TNCV_2052831 [Trichonephila clavipes]|nr:hypothetical protein TNCV_2052831 [Trichonephila clavipes]
MPSRFILFHAANSPRKPLMLFKHSTRQNFISISLGKYLKYFRGLFFKFYEKLYADSSFSPTECLCTCSLNDAVLPSDVIGKDETGHMDRGDVWDDVT